MSKKRTKKPNAAPAAKSTTAGGMSVRMVAIDKIKPYGQNPRLNDGAVDGVARSIESFGFRQPIVVDREHVIIVGHTRWKAAKRLGLDKVPIHIATDLTPAQVRAYRIADNKTPEASKWDDDLLLLELEQVQADDQGLFMSGFDEEELKALLEKPEGGKRRKNESPLPSVFQVICTCDDEEQQRAVYDAVKAMGVTCKLSTL